MTILIYGITLNSLKFLSTILLDYTEQRSIYIKEMKILEKCLDELNGLYQKGGFNIIEIHFNNKLQKSWTVMQLKIIHQFE